MSDHRNAFGFLRLVLASLVIVSHTPELVDGDRHRELLTLAFGTISFGELAVDGFFVISGYLITQSFLRTDDVRTYFAKRVCRIYPGFVVACLFCLLIVAPLAGGDSIVAAPGQALQRIAFLAPPVAKGAFAGDPYPSLNGAMWTIAYEFRCYILVSLLGVLGVFRHRGMVLLLAAACFLAHAVADPQMISTVEDRLPMEGLLIGSIVSGLRLAGAFLAGSAFLLYRDRLAFTGLRIVAASVLLAILMRVQLFAEPALCLFGGYLLLAAADRGGGTVLHRINNRNDISYGVYLYAWPIELLLRQMMPAAPLFVLGLATWGAACLFGWASWKLVEQPALRLVRGRGRGPSGPGKPVGGWMGPATTASD